MRCLALALAFVFAAAPAIACPTAQGVVRTIFTERPETTPPDAEIFSGVWTAGPAEPPVAGWGAPVGYLARAEGDRLAIYGGMSSCHHDWRRDFGGDEVWIVGVPLIHEGEVIGLRARGRGRNGTADWAGTAD